MSIYPIGYQDQRLIVGDTDLTTEFQLILVDGYELKPPEPKIYTVDIPGGNGVVDLTEALGGDVAFTNREQQFVFKCIYPTFFEKVKTKVSNFLHGKYFNYSISWDPGYTYRGRFSVVDYSHIGLAKGILGEIVIKVSADPYKYLDDKIYSINGVGGETYFFPSGRKPVRPVVETSRPTLISWKGETFSVGAGTYRLSNVLFTEGVNELYINTYVIMDTEWQDLYAGGSHVMSWDTAMGYTWDQLQRIRLTHVEPNFTNKPSVLAATSDGTDPVSGRMNFYAKAYRWVDLSTFEWNKLLNDGWTWDGMNYNPSPGEPPIPGGNIPSEDSGNSGNNSRPSHDSYDFTSTSMYLTYEWGDL